MIYQETILLIDCLTLCHRAKHVIDDDLKSKGLLEFPHGEKQLSRKRLENEIIFIFLKQLLSIVNSLHTNNIIFIWDSGISFRKKIYPLYKAHRKKERTTYEKRFDEIVYKQIQRLRLNIIPNLGFKNNFIQTGLEADDIIASITHNEKHNKFIIISNDNDLYQLVRSNKVVYYSIRNKKLFTEKQFTKIYGIKPKQWAEVKAIAGCYSDNVKGIGRVGEKTATKYIRKTLSKKLLSYKNITSEEGKEIIERNIKLVKLPFEGTKIYVYIKDNLKANDFSKVFDSLNFRSFLKHDNKRRWAKVFNLR